MIMTAIGIGMCVIGTIGIIYTIANKEKFSASDEDIHND